MGNFPFRAEREAVRLDLNWDFRRVGFFGVLKSAKGLFEFVAESIPTSSSEFGSSDSSDTRRGSFAMTSSLGGDRARVRRDEGKEGDDNEEIVEDDLEKLRRGDENGWQSKTSWKLESSVSGDCATHFSDLMVATDVSPQGHVEKDPRNSMGGVEPASDSIEREDGDASECWDTGRFRALGRGMATGDE
jgi:hypothetical protein